MLLLDELWLHVQLPSDVRICVATYVELEYDSVHCAVFTQYQAAQTCTCNLQGCSLDFQINTTRIFHRVYQGTYSARLAVFSWKENKRRRPFAVCMDASTELGTTSDCGLLHVGSRL